MIIMKKWKRWMAAGLSLSMLGASGLVASAAEVKVSSDKTKVSAGEDITVTLTLDQALEDVTCFEYRIYYDPEKFTYVEEQSNIGSACVDTAISSKPMTYGVDGQKCYSVSFVDPSANGQSLEAGKIASLTFQAVEDMNQDWQDSFNVVRAHFAKADMWTSLNETDDARVSYEVAGDVTYGDVNGDGSIDNFDAVLAFNYFVGSARLDADQIKAADVNGDETVDNFDAVMIFNYFVGSQKSFPVQNSNE